MRRIRPSKWRILAILTCGFIGFAIAGKFAPMRAETSVMPAAVPTYSYRIGFWNNLHHMLYAQASPPASARRPDRISLQPDDTAMLAHLSDSERSAWSSAVDYYSAHLRQKDLLFDDEMIELGRALSAAPDDAPPPNLPPDLSRALQAAAPIYRRYRWPAERSTDERWRAGVEALLRRHGQGVTGKLMHAVGSPWPSSPVHVELVGYANWAGAYTSLDPTWLTIGTRQEGNDGDAALEVLLHETLHGQFQPLVQELDRIKREILSRPGANAAAVRRDLWHEILFYIAGRAVADEIPGYVPYADRNGLWSRAWPGPDRELIDKNIGPYVEGRGTLEAALRGLVTDLAATPPARPTHAAS